MLPFLLRRFAQAVLVMLVVGMGAFALFQYVGDPVGSMLAPDAPAAQRARLHAELGLDQPAPVQFARFVGRALMGDFGLSLRQGRAVSALFAERLPATLELSAAAALITGLLGVPLGVHAALRRGRWDAHLSMAASLLGASLPTFLVGIVLIELFSVLLGWLPGFGRGATVQLGGWSTGLLTLDGWRHLALPAFTLALYQTTLVMRLVRAHMLEALRSDYVKFARARGLPDRVVHYGHALRNGLVPVLTVSGLQLGGLIAFSVVTETVFAWPGMGSLFIQAVQFPDVPVLAAYLCFIALLFVGVGLVVDLLYAVVDPRLRSHPAGAAWPP